jgi:hypothetical protein
MSAEALRLALAALEDLRPLASEDDFAANVRAHNEAIKACRAALAAADAQPSPSEAVYGFAGWLTCRSAPVTMSAVHDAAPVADLVAQFCESQGFAGPRDRYADMLKPYPPDQGEEPTEAQPASKSVQKRLETQTGGKA